MNPDETSPWIHTDLDCWSILTHGRVPYPFKKNTILFHQEDPSGLIYIVRSGRIRITSYQKNGAEKQLYIAEQGTLFGECASMMRHPHVASAVAIVDSMIYVIPYTDVETAMNGNWDLNTRVLNMLCRKNSVLLKQVVELSFSDSLQRIAQVLINLGREYGHPEAEGLRISIRFTHQDVANLTNTSRVTVSNAFNLFSSRGIITKQEGRYALLELDSLHQIADGYYEDSLCGITGLSQPEGPHR